MNKILIVALVLALMMASANAFPVKTPQQVDVYEEGKFYVEITNPYAEPKDLSINFYTPAEVKISAPSKIVPKANVTAVIEVHNDYDTYREMASKLEVKLGNETEEKEVSLRFFEREGTADNPFVGMFGMGAFTTQATAFTLAEWATFWVLVAIAAILIIALAARVVHRI